MAFGRWRYPRRTALKFLGAAGAGLALGSLTGTDWAFAQESPQSSGHPAFTGPGANHYWNSVGPYVTEPQKAPLILLTDRPVQLETPRQFFRTAFTPNEAFFVRWHLPEIPNSVDLSEWKLRIEGNVEKPLTLGFGELVHRFKSVSIAAVNQCSGNTRSR